MLLKRRWQGWKRWRTSSAHAELLILILLHIIHVKNLLWQMWLKFAAVLSATTDEQKLNEMEAVPQWYWFEFIDGPGDC